MWQKKNPHLYIKLPVWARPNTHLWLPYPQGCVPDAGSGTNGVKGAMPLNCPNRRRSAFYLLPMRSSFSALKSKSISIKENWHLVCTCFVSKLLENVFLFIPGPPGAFYSESGFPEQELAMIIMMGQFQSQTATYNCKGRAVLAPFKIPVLPYSSYTSPS